MKNFKIFYSNMDLGLTFIDFSYSSKQFYLSSVSFKKLITALG